MPQLVGKDVGEIGYGLMGHTWRPNPSPEPQLIQAMRTAVQAGANVWSGAEFYGPPEYNSLVLLERYLRQYPEDADKIVIAVKGAAGNGHEDCNNPEGIRKSIDHVISQLKGTKKIDLFGPARRSPASSSIAESMGVIQKEYVDTGKIGGILLSEVSAATIEEAVKYAKIDALEAELSMWSPDILTNGVAEACAKHGITLLAYSPLGRGFLTGQIRKPEDFPEGDFRRTMPRFQPDVFDLNLQLVDQVTKLAEKKGITPGQLAVSWVKGLGKRPGMPTIIPIPGAVHEKRVAENVVYVDLSDEEMKEIDDILAKFEVKGTRYWAGHPIEG